MQLQIQNCIPVRNKCTNLVFPEAKLREGVSLEAVLDGVRENLDGTFQRLNLLTRQDLYNIMRDNNINNHERLHTNDYVSVQLWVERMHMETDNPVLFFKHQGQPDKTDILDRPPDGLLEDKDFMLVIMTVPQQQLFKKLGSDRVCVDGTHGTTGKHILYIYNRKGDFVRQTATKGSY